MIHFSSLLPTTPLPRAVWILSWVSFFADVSSEMIYPLLPLFLVGVLGSSKTELGIIEGSAVLIVSIMTAIAGFKSDRNSKRVPWIRWGYGLPVLGKGVIALATFWPMVLGGRLLDRFGKGLRSAPRDALIVGAVNSDQRGRAFGLHRAFDTAGALVGVLLSAFLLWWLTGTPQEGSGSTSGIQTPASVFRAIFGVGSLLGLASLALTLLVRESEKASDSEILKESGSAVGELTSKKISMPRSYWYVLAMLTLFSFANSSDTFILLRASDLGYSPWSVVLVYALYNFTYSTFSYPAGALSDRLGRWSIIGIGWGIYAIVYGCFALLPPSHAWGLWPLMGIYGIYMALTDGVGKALIADNAPKEKRGAAMGIFYAVTGLSSFGASLLAGLLWDKHGPKPMFLIGAAISLAALLLLIGIRCTFNSNPRDTPWA